MTVDRINALLRQYGAPEILPCALSLKSTPRGDGVWRITDHTPAHTAIDSLDRLAGAKTFGTVGERLRAHEKLRPFPI